MPTRLTLDLVTLIGQMQLVIPYLYLTDFDLVNFTKWDKDRKRRITDLHIQTYLTTKLFR